MKISRKESGTTDNNSRDFSSETLYQTKAPVNVSLPLDCEGPHETTKLLYVQEAAQKPPLTS